MDSRKQERNKAKLACKQRQRNTKLKKETHNLKSRAESLRFQPPLPCEHLDINAVDYDITQTPQQNEESEPVIPPVAEADWIPSGFVWNDFLRYEHFLDQPFQREGSYLVREKEAHFAADNPTFGGDTIINERTKFTVDKLKQNMLKISGELSPETNALLLHTVNELLHKKPLCSGWNDFQKNYIPLPVR